MTKAELPILFSGPMVSAIREGRKTQTRRVVTIYKPGQYQYQVGQRLWVRETFYNDIPGANDVGHVYYRADGTCCEQIPECQCAKVGKPKWTPGIFMPRWASRLLLEVVRVKTQRVQEITEAEALAEGIATQWCDDGGETPGRLLYFSAFDAPGVGWPTSRDAFKSLWTHINPERPFRWESNPQVRAVEFKIEKQK